MVILCLLLNAVQVFKVSTPAMPLVRAALYFPFGVADDAAGEEGATSVLAEWLTSGTKQKDKAAFERSKMTLGAEISVSVNARHTLVSVEAPSDTFSAAWDLALEMVGEPRFDEDEGVLARNVNVATKRQLRARWIDAGKMFVLATTFAGTPDARAVLGTEKALFALTPARLKVIHAATFARGPAAVLLSQTASAEHEKLVRESTEGSPAKLRKIERRAFTPKGRNLVIVERPESTQAYAFLAKDGPFVGSDDHALLSVATKILGANGDAPSLLFDELRSSRGLTYHASIQATRLPGGGIMGVTFGANENIEPLIRGYLDVWSAFLREPQSLDALREADMAYKTRRARENNATFAAIFDAAAQTLTLSSDIVPQWKSPEITVEAVQAAKQRWLSPNDFTLIVLGDSKAVRPALEKALAPVRRTVVLPADADWDAVSAATAKP